MQPKTVLITGCSSGIGRATALAFADEGWTVYATARDPADIETLGEAGCKTDRLDVTEQDDIDRVVDRILDEEGAPSIRYEFSDAWPVRYEAPTLDAQAGGVSSETIVVTYDEMQRTQ